jgi:tetratricopeptide (TPR) repeat protein
MRKNIIFSIITFFIVFTCLELLFRIVSVPGSYKFIERRLIEQNMSVRKAKNEIRVMMYGESTMFGGELYPYSTIPKWTQSYLEDVLGASTGKKINVVNLGRLGEDSVFISNTFKETVGYKPDVVVFFTAHNDFIELEHRAYKLRRKNIGEHASNFFKILSKRSAFLSALTRASIRLKFRKQGKRIGRDDGQDNWYNESSRKNLENDDSANYLVPNSNEFNEITFIWKNNVESIIKVAQKKNIPVIFLSPIKRYKDYPPFQSVHKQSLTNKKLTVWDDLFEKTEVLFKEGQYQQAAMGYERLLEIDDQYALTYYRRGQVYEYANDFKSAKKLYNISNDLDYFPIRAPSVTNDFYNELKERDLEGVTVIPSQSILEDLSDQRFLTDDIVYDQIHPNIKGQAVIAKEVVAVICDQKEITGSQGCAWENEQTFDKMEGDLGMSDEILSNFYVKVAIYAGSYFDAATKGLKKAIKLNPRSMRAHSMLAWCYLQLGEIDLAHDVYRKLYTIAPVKTKNYLEKEGIVVLGLNEDEVTSE